VRPDGSAHDCCTTATAGPKRRARCASSPTPSAARSPAWSP
jgi:hypothetical protein